MLGPDPPRSLGPIWLSNLFGLESEQLSGANSWSFITLYLNPKPLASSIEAHLLLVVRSHLVKAASYCRSAFASIYRPTSSSNLPIPVLCGKPLPACCSNSRASNFDLSGGTDSSGCDWQIVSYSGDSMLATTHT